jgi:hypothetical protein
MFTEWVTELHRTIFSLQMQFLPGKSCAKACACPKRSGEGLDM